MHYLIDGHNLIAKTPDISLQEEHDEAKLILRLKGWAAASKKRQITVIFDRGLPGGEARFRSNRQVTVVFASGGETADSLLIKRIRTAKDVKAYTVVSNDRVIMAAAKTRRMPCLPADEFVKRYWQKTVEKPTTPEKVERPSITPEEVADWLERFGPVPEKLPTPPKKKTAPPTTTPTTQPSEATTPKEETSGRKKRKEKQRPLVPAKRGERDLSQEEVAEWLALFGPEPTKKTKKKSKSTTTKRPASPSPKPDKSPPSLKTDKTGEQLLDEDEVAEWLRLFGDDP